MKSGRRIRFAISVPIALMLSIGCSAVAQTGGNKIDLQNDVSLGDIFQMMGKRLEAELPAAEFQQFAFQAHFRFPHMAIWRDPIAEADPRSNQIFGVDVSHHVTDSCHCKIDWSKLASQKVAFAYLKATQGDRYVDRSFKPNLDGIRALPANRKIAVGAFHFLSADGTARDQAQNFLDVTGALTSGDLVPSLDVEWDVRTDAQNHVIRNPDGTEKDFWDGTDGAEILARVNDWLRIVQAKTNKTPIVYTNATWWKQKVGAAGKIEDLTPKYKVWISDLSDKGLKVEQPFVYKGQWQLFQFTFTATADQGGLPTGQAVDADVFNGDIAQFNAVMK